MNNPKPVLTLGLTPALQKIHFFEKFVPGEVNRSSRVETHAGGKASTVAMALAVLGDVAYGGDSTAGGRAVPPQQTSPRAALEPFLNWSEPGYSQSRLSFAAEE